MNIFLKTALITFFVFSLGIAIGLWIDLSRSQSVDDALQGTSIELLDITALEQLYDTVGNSTEFCDAAIRSNLEFNARIYEEGKQLDREESVAKLSDLTLRQKRYALLQMQFWLNAIKLKQRCDADYDTVAYFYAKTPQSGQKTTQAVQSEVLSALKNECGNRIMLVPLPLDMSIASIDAVKAQFSINSAPSTLVNEKTLLEGVQTLEKMRSSVTC
ncbi:MAG: hypothetical protein HY365_01670 [Candidatus Aenigmarchaeota archaeon]|nr:hypothetical protein [Candidatus Aenigmarchaeota archaeon]